MYPIQMYPIQEQGHKRGIGHSLDSFLKRFDEICKEHLKEGRAKAFAFIFYDFKDNALRRILKDQRVFAELDRLSGRDLTVFYLHAGEREAVNKFNTEFLTKLNIAQKATLPCVVFFRAKGDRIEDVAIAQLDHADLIHGFHELYSEIKKYTEAGLDQVGVGSKALKWIKRGGLFIGVVAFEEAMSKAIGAIIG